MKPGECNAVLVSFRTFVVFFSIVPVFASSLSQTAEAKTSSCIRSLFKSTEVLHISHVRAAPNPMWSDLSNSPLGGRLEREAKDVWPVINWAARVSEASSNSLRLKTIQDFPLNDLIIKPGHNPVRDPAAVLKLAEKMAIRYLPAQTAADRPSLNILTRADGSIIGVEAISGHHRFLAKMKLGAIKVKDLCQEELDVYVNGVMENGKLSVAKFPAHGLDFKSASSWPPVPRVNEWAIPTSAEPSWMKKPKDALLSRLIKEGRIALRTDKGELSGELLLNARVPNEQVGSRSTLGSSFASLSRNWQPQVGIMRLASEALPSLEHLRKLGKGGFEEIVLIPSSKGSEKDLLSRIYKLNNQLENLK
ncbi:MAG TPA: hypothetical protein DCS07_00650, partial [Bdellovibrionales bacterium]|nr:hypothetical protein [Bdellovibrionales bacterium]